MRYHCPLPKFITNVFKNIFVMCFTTFTKQVFYNRYNIFIFMYRVDLAYILLSSSNIPASFTISNQFNRKIDYKMGVTFVKLD